MDTYLMRILDIFRDIIYLMLASHAIRVTRAFAKRVVLVVGLSVCFDEAAEASHFGGWPSPSLRVIRAAA
eukprot:9162126-Pyramimonas_sp.AAC.1